MKLRFPIRKTKVDFVEKYRIFCPPADEPEGIIDALKYESSRFQVGKEYVHYKYEDHKYLERERRTAVVTGVNKVKAIMKMKKARELKVQLLAAKPKIEKALDEEWGLDPCSDLMREFASLGFQMKCHSDLKKRVKLLADRLSVETELEKTLAETDINMIYLKSLVEKAQALDHSTSLTKKALTVLEFGISEGQAANMLRKAAEGFLSYDLFKYYLEKSTELGISDKDLIETSRKIFKRYTAERDALKRLKQTFEDSNFMDVLAEAQDDEDIFGTQRATLRQSVVGHGGEKDFLR